MTYNINILRKISYFSLSFLFLLPGSLMGQPPHHLYDDTLAELITADQAFLQQNGVRDRSFNDYRNGLVAAANQMRNSLFASATWAHNQNIIAGNKIKIADTLCKRIASVLDAIKVLPNVTIALGRLQRFNVGLMQNLENIDQNIVNLVNGVRGLENSPHAIVNNARIALNRANAAYTEIVDQDHPQAQTLIVQLNDIQTAIDNEALVIQNEDGIIVNGINYLQADIEHCNTIYNRVTDLYVNANICAISIKDRVGRINDEIDILDAYLQRMNQFYIDIENINNQ